MALIEFNDFSFSYLNSDGSESQVKSLDSISLEIDYGDFVLLCGPSGCGKTTLLTNLKKELMPAGRRTGEIKFNGVRIQDLDDISSACDIGYLFQNPDHQICCNTVREELMFGFKALGIHTAEAEERVDKIIAESMSYKEFHRKIVNLLNVLLLVSLMSRNPSVDNVILYRITYRLINLLWRCFFKSFTIEHLYISCYLLLEGLLVDLCDFLHRVLSSLIYI